jgi:penicillin amidase
MERAAAEPLIFSAWARRLMEGVFSDELRDVEHQPWQPRYSALLRTFLDSQVWCDDITTADRQESCKQIATRALDLALADISDRYGADMSRWQWGKAHQAVNEHPIFGRIPVLKDIFNLSIDSDGSFDTLNRATFRGRAGDDFSTRHGAGYRAVYDLSDPEQSRFMISTGQSGNILSDHYSDLLRRWRDGKHRTITGSPADLIRQGAKVLTLTPS